MTEEVIRKVYIMARRDYVHWFCYRAFFHDELRIEVLGCVFELLEVFGLPEFEDAGAFFLVRKATQEEREKLLTRLFIHQPLAEGIDEEAYYNSEISEEGDEEIAEETDVIREEIHYYPVGMCVNAII